MRSFNHFIFFLLILFFTACPGDNRPSAQNNKGAVKTPPDTSQAVTQTQPKRIIDLKPKDESKTTSPQPAPRQVSDTTSFFSLSPGQRIIVEDFKIGPLQDFLIGQYDRIKAASVVHDFFEGLSKKEIKQELIKPEMRTEMKRSLSYSLKNSLLPEEFRIGKIIPEASDEISVNIRIFKGQSVTEGEVYLLKEDGEWMIIDMQIGFTLLAEKYNKDTEPFSPSSYKWLLKDYLE
jgi:hypothetical protein